MNSGNPLHPVDDVDGMNELDNTLRRVTEYDLSGRIIGLAMKVHSALGHGFLETVYRNAMAHELRKAGIRFEAEKAIQVRYDGVVLGDFFADFLIDSVLAIELKAVQILSTVHEVQTVNCLKATGMETGLLLNFGADRLEFRKKRRTVPLKADFPKQGS
jgi:GxxExxY protein